MRTLHIHLLGDFHLLHGEDALAGIDTPRPQSVLAYLVLHRQSPQLRQHTAFALWPTSAESQARTNLRKQIHHLRQALPDADRYLHVDGNTVQWRPDAPSTLDVAEFEREITAAQQAREAGDAVAMRAALEKASLLYRGNLLPSCYDEWILSPRERLFHMYIRALDQLARSFEAQRDYATAAHYAQRLLRYDPMRETAYRRLMRLHALNGDRAKALQAYHQCATVLERELDVEPCQATQAAYERLLVTQPTASRPVRRSPLGNDAPLVGRRPAWAQLQVAWRIATHRQPHVALISGEAGIGKTRLAEELLAWAERQGIATAPTRSLAVEKPVAYAPITDWLRTDTLCTAMSRLDDVWLTELARLLPELSTEHPTLPHPQPLTRSWRRQRLFEAIARAILAVGGPLMLFIDDLQWSDEQTLAWLSYLLQFEPSAQLLVIGTMRPAEVPQHHLLSTLLTELQARGQLTHIDLRRLNEAETATLAGHVAKRDLGVEEQASLYRETEGNPLFVVETVRADLADVQRGSIRLEAFDPAGELRPDPDPPSLPPKVRAVIERRLKQLSAQARNLAEVAAVIGREFALGVVVRASDQPENIVVTALDELWQRRIIREQEGDTYDFSHGKIREVTYDKLTLARRHLLHDRVARAVEALAAANVADAARDPVFGCTKGGDA